MALSKDRNTLSRSVGPLVRYKVGAVKIYAGAHVSVNATGYLVPSSNTAGQRSVGRAAEQVDNSAGSPGDLSCDVQEGCFKWVNSTTKAVEQADVGRPVFVEDDQTVADESSMGVVAGVMTEIDPDGGIWVETYLDSAAPEELGIETVAAAGAISPKTRTTRLEVTGTTAYTLADGLYNGQRKTIVCKVASTTPIGTVTPATVASPDTTLVFKGVGDFAELEWHVTGGWVVLFKVLTA